MRARRLANDEGKERAMIKLYDVRTIAKECGGCKNVPFIWICNRPENKQPHGPWEELIEGYRPDGRYGYTQSAIGEFFTADEANALKDYIDREHGDIATTTITEASLPFPNCWAPLVATEDAGNFYELDKAPGYSLPFRVWGYFNLVGCEMAGGSGRTYPPAPTENELDAFPF
jgi:hypothetical protein